MQFLNMLFTSEESAVTQAEPPKTPVAAPSSLEIPGNTQAELITPVDDDYDTCEIPTGTTPNEESPEVPETKSASPKVAEKTVVSPSSKVTGPATPPASPSKPIETSPVAEALPVTTTHRPPPPIVSPVSKTQTGEPVEISLSPSESRSRAEHSPSQSRTETQKLPDQQTHSRRSDRQSSALEVVDLSKLQSPPILSIKKTEKSSWQWFVENCCPCFQDLLERIRHRNHEKVHRI